MAIRRLVRCSRLLRPGLLATGALAAPIASAGPAPTLAGFVGVYEGTWSNTTAQTSGPAHIRIESDGTNGTIGFDVDGPVFGFLNPPELVLTAPLGSHAVAQTDATFGNVACNGSPASFTCTGTVSQNAPSLVSASITGSIHDDLIDTTYSLTFLGNQMYAGTLVATKTPESGPAAGALAACAALGGMRRRARR